MESDSIVEPSFRLGEKSTNSSFSLLNYSKHGRLHLVPYAVSHASTLLYLFNPHIVITSVRSRDLHINNAGGQNDSASKSVRVIQNFWCCTHQQNHKTIPKQRIIKT